MQRLINEVESWIETRWHGWEIRSRRARLRAPDRARSANGSVRSITLCAQEIDYRLNRARRGSIGMVIDHTA